MSIRNAFGRFQVGDVRYICGRDYRVTAVHAPEDGGGYSWEPVGAVTNEVEHERFIDFLGNCPLFMKGGPRHGVLPDDPAGVAEVARGL